jgi:hypothetical protein
MPINSHPFDLSLEDPVAHHTTNLQQKPVQVDGSPRKLYLLNSPKSTPFNRALENQISVKNGRHPAGFSFFIHTIAPVLT